MDRIKKQMKDVGGKLEIVGITTHRIIKCATKVSR